MEYKQRRFTWPAKYVHSSLNFLALLLTHVKATVLAVGVFSDDPHLYSARPFAVSGTCKREHVLLQKSLLENACKALTQKAPDIAGRLYSIASDGDSRRRQATVLLTMDRELELESELHEILGQLELLNLRCGSDQETPDFEYKHLLKRLRNTLLRMKCTTLDGVVLTPQLLKSHLL